MQADHLTEEELERFAMRRLEDESELARVEEHLLVCAACAERVQEMDEFVNDMKLGLRQIHDEGTVRNP